MPRRCRPAIPLSLEEGEKEKLESVVCSRPLPHSKVQRVQIVLECAEGESQAVIAERLGAL